MNLYRLWHSLRLVLIRDGYRRAEYAKKNDIYNSVGNNVMIMPRKVPLYSKLIRFHNNIQIASGVSFITHDVTHDVFKNIHKGVDFKEEIGCIEIMDNVFIGANTTILPNVRIGPNVIIAAGSVVNKDIPKNTIWGGVPARQIGLFEDLFEKRLEKSAKSKMPPFELGNITSERVEAEWKVFMENRDLK